MANVTAALWHDDLWTLHAPVGGSLPGTVWLASREHFDSFADMPAGHAADFGRVAGRVERAICRWATSAASTCTGGATAARTSTCGSCRARLA